MIVLRRSPMKRAAPPWPRRPERQWGGQMPAPRPIVAARAVSGPARVPFVPQPKENPIQHEGYMRIVRGFCCAHCFKAPRNEFSHADTGKGTGLRTDCRRGYPACKACHYLIGSTGKLGKAERRRIEDLYGAETRAKVEAAGLWPKRLPRWIE